MVSVLARIDCRSWGAEYGTINKVALLGKREAQKKGVGMGSRVSGSVVE